MKNTTKTNTDPRYVESGRILAEVDTNLPLQLSKVARAGATTGLMANCIDSNTTALLIAPTRNIAHETIKESIIYSGKPKANIQVLLSNHDCLLNKDLIYKHPDIKKIPVLPLPKQCNKCELFDVCPVTEFIRADPNKVDGIGITYQKLKALVFSQSEVANSIKAMLSTCDVVIYDEAHIFETPDTINIQVYPKLKLDVYQKLFADNKNIAPTLEKFAQLVHEKQTTIMQLVREHDDAEHNLMSIKLKDGIDKIEFKQIVSGINEIVDIMINRDKYDLSVDEVLYIFNIIMSFASDTHVLRYLKTSEGGFVYLSTTDSLLPAVRKFQNMFNPGTGCKTIFTTATFGDYDYTHIFGFHVQGVMKDVMGTNKRMTIYPDTFNMDTINYSKQYHERIIKSVIKYVKKYPGIKFICMTKTVFLWLKYRMKELGYENLNIDYYRSANMIGVSSPDRRCVCVGAPVMPINAFDGISETPEESQKRRIGNNQAAYFQSINRFKSPDGSEDTEIFCIGITEDVIRQMIKWGRRRRLELDGIRCIGVEVDEPFDEPNVVSLESNRVYKVVLDNPRITRTEIIQKLRMSSSDVKMHIKKLIGQCLISAEVLDIKRKPLGYTA